MTRQVFDWTDKRVETLKDLWKQGLSAGQIQKRLNWLVAPGETHVSRSAVLGKVHRLGLSKRDPTNCAWRVPPAPRTPAPRKPTNKNFRFGAASLQRQKRASGPAQHAPRPAEAPALAHCREQLKDIAVCDTDPPEHERVTVSEIQDHQCHWPLDGKFCGRPTCSRGSGSYCTEHADRAHRAPETKQKWTPERRAAQAARARRTYLERQSKEQTHG